MNEADLEHAQQLTSQIRSLALRDDYRGLLAVAARPETEELLDLLSSDLASAARVHLDAADRWRQRKADANRRRLAEAQAALDAFDVSLARALLGRIEEDWLEPDDEAARDQLLLRLSARTMETEELSTLASEAIEEHKPRKRWWRRDR
jgi:hypothetical protein